MPHTSTLQILDRLAVKSVMRGGTSTVCGLLGTLTLLILCFAIYIPPTEGYFRGNFFESQFYSQKSINQTFYSTQDFKIAIQFRHKKNNSVADHQAMLNWAYAEYIQELADYSNSFIEPASQCRRDYLADAVNPVELEDCFIFPDNSIFYSFWSDGVYTTLLYQLIPQASDNPFSGILGPGRFAGVELLMNQLLS